MATSGVVAVPNAQGQSACRLFALHTELRNFIYELTFELHVPTDKIDLLNASRPSRKPLLLTCRLMYNEVRGLWRTFYRRYWSKTKFTLHRRAKSMRMGDFMERDLARVRHITLVVSGVANNGFLDPGPLSQLANRVGRLEVSSGPNSSLANYEREPGGDWRCTSFRGVDLPEDVLAPRKNFAWQIGDRKTLVGDIDSSDTFVHITRTELCGMLGHALWLREWLIRPPRGPPLSGMMLVTRPFRLLCYRQVSILTACDHRHPAFYLILLIYEECLNMSVKTTQSQRTNDIEFVDSSHRKDGRGLWGRKTSATERRRKPWRSFMLRIPMLIVVGLLQLGLICSLAVLGNLSKRHSGFVKVDKQYAMNVGLNSHEAQGSLDLAFLWTTVPTLLMTLVALFWASIVTAYACEAPMMSLKAGAPMHQTVLLDYRRYPACYVYIRAWKNGHILLGCCLLSAFVASVFLGPLAAHMFQVITPSIERYIALSQRGVYNDSRLTPAIDYSPVIGLVSAVRVYHGNWPHYTDGIHAVPRHALPDLEAEIPNTTEVSINTTAYSATLSCQIVQDYSMSSNSEGDGRATVALGANDRGCEIFLKVGVGPGTPILLKTGTNADCTDTAGYSRIAFLAGFYSASAAYLLDSMSVISCMPNYTTTMGTALFPPDFSSLTFHPQPESEADARPAGWKQFEDALIALSNIGNNNSPDFTSQFGSLMLEMIRTEDPSNVLDAGRLMDAASTAFSSAYAVFTGIHLFEVDQAERRVPGRIRLFEVRLASVPWSVYTSIVILALMFVLSVWMNIVVNAKTPRLAEEPRGLLSAASVLYMSNLAELLEDEEWRSAYNGRLYEWLQKKYILGQERCTWTVDGTIQVYNLVHRSRTPPPDRLS
ncbi:hypothetical protein LTR17_001497 [Elasticomyces elasticus]|nr:hypothetical protein LTR17_001497 [Elasticomyces elasticus]